MRRSNAPSVLLGRQNGDVQPPSRASLPLSSRPPPNGSLRSSSSSSSTVGKTSNDTGAPDVIERMPLFGFLEIPNNLQKKFELPKGCVVTKETLALRQRKTLGRNASFQPFTAAMLKSGYKHPVPMASGSCDDDDDNGDMEALPVANLPPFEPLVLWKNENDPEHKIEVIPSLAAKLRPHQREGVKFLFECTMGMRGFQGSGYVCLPLLRKGDRTGD